MEHLTLTLTRTRTLTLTLTRSLVRLAWLKTASGLICLASCDFCFLCAFAEPSSLTSARLPSCIARLG